VRGDVIHNVRPIVTFLAIHGYCSSGRCRARSYCRESENNLVDAVEWYVMQHPHSFAVASWHFPARQTAVEPLYAAAKQTSISCVCLFYPLTPTVAMGPATKSILCHRL